MKKLYILMKTVSSAVTKQNIFKVFGEGIKDTEWKIIFYNGPPKAFPDADLLAMFSFFNVYKTNAEFTGSALAKYRKNIYNLNKDKMWVFLDGDPTNGSLKKEWIPTLSYYRISFISPYPDEGCFLCYDGCEKDNSRWNRICKEKDIVVKPWRDSILRKDGYVLLLLQSTILYSMKEVDFYKWVNQTLVELRKWSKRHVLIRMKKNEFNIATKWQDMIKDPINNISMSKGKSLIGDLDGAWASLLYSTSACISSIIQGVPVFCGHKSCLTWDVSSSDLSKIENPYMPDRLEFFNKLSWCIWNLNDFKSGLCWTYMKRLLDNPDLMKENYLS